MNEKALLYAQSLKLKA